MEQTQQEAMALLLSTIPIILSQRGKDLYTQNNVDVTENESDKQVYVSALGQYPTLANLTDTQSYLHLSFLLLPPSRGHT